MVTHATVQDWCESNTLTVNPEKTQVMLFTIKRKFSLNMTEILPSTKKPQFIPMTARSVKAAKSCKFNYPNRPHPLPKPS